MPRSRLPNMRRRAVLAATMAAVSAAALLAAGCATDTIEDRRYGQQVVCHDGETITVSNADSFVHLDHGDSLGPCPTD